MTLVSCPHFLPKPSDEWTPGRVNNLRLAGLLPANVGKSTPGLGFNCRRPDHKSAPIYGVLARQNELTGPFRISLIQKLAV